jgi:Zn-dependent protease
VTAGTAAPSLNRLAVSATNHCLTGCAAGEIVGLVLATLWGWDTVGSIGLAVVLAFVFAYALTMRTLLRAKIEVRRALRIALAADTLSIVVMETVDNGVILLIPGAMEAGLPDPLFWGSLALGLGIAWLFAFPVNRWLLARGQGHALVSGHHGGHHEPTPRHT